MKSDEQLQSEVQAEINANPRIAQPGRIGVSVQHGVVTLSGQVEREVCRWEAERAAWRVEGVRAVAGEIEVDSGKDPGEAEIADAVATLLEWSTELDAKDIHTRVEDGWITLEGSVSQLAESQAAARLASQIRGVKGVSNRIRIGAREPVAAVPGTMTEHAAGWTPIDEEC